MAVHLRHWALINYEYKINFTQVVYWMAWENVMCRVRTPLVDQNILLRAFHIFNQRKHSLFALHLVLRGQQSG